MVDSARLDDLGRPRTANERLLDRTIRHAHYIQRLATTEANKVRSFLERDMLPDLRGAIARELAKLEAQGLDGTARLDRLQSLRASVEAILGRGFAQVETMTAGDMMTFAPTEGKLTVEALKASLPEELKEPRFAIEVEFPPPDILNSIVTKSPIAGKKIGEWWQDLGDAGVREVVRQAQLGFTQGETIQQIMGRMFPTARSLNRTATSEKIKRDAEMIARTVTNGVSNAIRNATFEANSDIVGSSEWVATLDGVTCLTCSALDGKVFKMGKGPEPPEHPNCRCSRSPVLKNLRELGIADSDFRFKSVTRASMNGEVAATSKYGTWFKGQSNEFQNETLGPKRAVLFRRGVVPIDRFTDTRGDPLTLDELERLERRIEAGQEKREKFWPGEIKV